MKFNNSAFQKAFGIGSIIVAGVVAVANAIAEQKKEKEFEDMKKAIADLQNKES